VVVSVTHGRDAGEIAEQIKPDCFMLDYHFLDMNALELSHRLHTTKGLACIPTIFLNAPVRSWSEPQRYHTIFLGMPFALAELYTSVHKSLGRT
jgi:CheY-like chemotaxis protein